MRKLNVVLRVWLIVLMVFILPLRVYAVMFPESVLSDENKAPSKKDELEGLKQKEDRLLRKTSDLKKQENRFNAQLQEVEKMIADKKAKL